MSPYSVAYGILLSLALVSPKATAQSNKSEWLKGDLVMEVDLILTSDPSPQEIKRMESLNNQFASAKDEKKAKQILKQIDRLEEQILKRSKNLILGRIAEAWRAQPGGVGPVSSYWSQAPVLVILNSSQMKDLDLERGDFLDLKKSKYESHYESREKTKELIQRTSSDPRVIGEGGGPKHVFSGRGISEIGRPQWWPKSHCAAPWLEEDVELTRAANLTCRLTEVSDYVYKPFSLLTVEIKNSGAKKINFAQVTFSCVNDQGQLVESSRFMKYTENGTGNAYVRDLEPGQTSVVQFTIQKKHRAVVDKVLVLVRSIDS